MADEKKKKKKEESKIVLERTYNVPLRRRWMHVPKYKRAKKAVTTLKVFLEKHMKSDNIKLGKYVNEYLWEQGIRNPPHHVKVVAKKDDKGLVIAELEGAPEEKPKEDSKKKSIKKKEKSTIEKKLEEKEEKKKEKAEKEEKEELEAIKKEEIKGKEMKPAVEKEIGREKMIKAPHNLAPVDKQNN